MGPFENDKLKTHTFSWVYLPILRWTQNDKIRPLTTNTFGFFRLPMLRREPMQRGSCNFTASCKPLISLMNRVCTIIFSLIPRSIMSICINMSHFNSVHNWCSHVDFEVRYTRVHHFPKTRHHMSQVHCHRQEPETKASMRMAITQHFWESTKCNIKCFAYFGEHEANFWMSEWLANI